MNKIHIAGNNLGRSIPVILNCIVRSFVGINEAARWEDTKAVPSTSTGAIFISAGRSSMEVKIRSTQGHTFYKYQPEEKVPTARSCMQRVVCTAYASVRENTGGKKKITLY